MIGRFIRISAAAATFAAGVGVSFAAEENPAPAAEPKAKPAAAAPKIVPDPVFPRELEGAARAAAEQLALGLAESLKSGDFKAFQAAQPQTGRRMNADTFAKMRSALTKHYGEFSKAEYFGRLDQGRVMDFLWKFTFEAKSGAAANKRHEIIYWVRVGSAAGKPVVAGFSFNFY